MNILIATDSYKGSLSSLRAGEAIKQGALRAFPQGTVTVCALADGGEGTAEAIVNAQNGEMISIPVSDPLMRRINATYGLCGSCAVLEMATAAGITLVSNAERDAMNTTTYGVGEIIRDAIMRGSREFVVGIGGSATNDGGTGMLAALGFEFLDENGEKIELSGKGLERLRKIETKNRLKELDECTFTVACDVTNPLCGKNGCTEIYGRQKGLTEENVIKMDGWLKNYGELTKAVCEKADPEAAGAGAAGGLGFGFMAYLNGKLLSGIDIVLEKTGLEEKIKKCDIVVTGEGRLDGQSVMGKAPVGVARMAKKYEKPVIAFAGCVTDDAYKLNDHGIDAFFPILKAPCTLESAMDVDNAFKNLSDTAYQAFNLIKTFKE